MLCKKKNDLSKKILLAIMIPFRCTALNNYGNFSFKEVYDNFIFKDFIGVFKTKQKAKIDLILKIVIGFKLLTIFALSSIKDI